MLNTNGTIRVYNPDKKDVLIPNSGFTLTPVLPPSRTVTTWIDHFVTAEAMKHGGHELSRQLCTLCNNVNNLNIPPLHWCNILVVPIPE